MTDHTFSNGLKFTLNTSGANELRIDVSPNISGLYRDVAAALRVSRVSGFATYPIYDAGNPTGILISTNHKDEILQIAEELLAYGSGRGAWFTEKDANDARNIFGMQASSTVVTQQVMPRRQKTFTEANAEWLKNNEKALRALRLENADFDALSKAKRMQDLESIRYGIGIGEYTRKPNGLVQKQTRRTVFDDYIDAAQTWESGKGIE